MAPKFKKGDRVESLAEHMKGMKGSVGTVSIVRDGPYYGVTMDGEKDVHKWLSEDEVKASDSKVEKSEGKKDKGGMKGMSLTREIEPLQLRASFQPSSVNEETRTVELVWTTGEKVLRSSWDGQFFEELSLDPKHVRMGRLTSGRAPFLANHNGRDLDAVIGIIERADMKSATVRFAKDDPEADKAWNKVRQGILPNVSVGYRVHRFEEVKGSDPKIRTLRATDWEPYEVSLVPMGADSAAHVRLAPAEKNPCVFISGEEPSQEQHKMADEKQTPAAPAVDVDAARAEAAKLERNRVSEILGAVRTAKLGDEFAQTFVESGVSADEARKAVLAELAKRDAATASAPARADVTVTDDQSDKWQRGVSAWLYEKAGNGLVEQAAKRGLKGFEKVELDAGEFRGMSLLDIARESLERRGIKTRGIYDRVKLVELAMRATGYGQTSDFAVLFENVMYKSMRAAYALQADTWRRWIKTDSVSDFRASNRYLNGSFGTLDVVAEGEEYKNRAIPDGAKVSITTEKLGGIISISREAIINDDMGSLADLATRFGRSAGLTIETKAYALLAENSGAGPLVGGVNFFHASRGNLGSASALSVAGLQADRLLMRKQKDITGNEFLDLNPSILLVPVELEDSAKILNADAFDPGQTGQKTNPVRGLFSDIVATPRITNATRRYLFAGSKEAFVCAFLEGSGEGPTMESQEDFRRDGMSWKARIEFKVQPYDPKAAVYNPGA